MQKTQHLVCAVGFFRSTAIGHFALLHSNIQFLTNENPCHNFKIVYNISVKFNKEEYEQFRSIQFSF